jgi:hypothetical protein
LRRPREKAAHHKALFFAFLHDMWSERTKWITVFRAQQQRDIAFEFAQRLSFGRQLSR